jgi:hypothetical protein
MKKVILTMLFLLMASSMAFSQRILINQNFDNIPLSGDSLPPGWFQHTQAGSTTIGTLWAARDTGTTYPGANPNAVVAQAHSNPRGLTIPWTSGGPGNLADQWCYTDSFTVQTGDSLIFWLLIGSTPGITAYLDSMSVYTSLFQIPAVETRLAKIVSNDSAGLPAANNVWTEHKFSLNAFVGQTVYIAFRYFMDVSLDGLWCNIDDVFVGNRAAVNISQIGTNVPGKFDLFQNYPNPFNPKTNIKFDLAKATNVKLTVYNALGQEVKTLVNEYKPAGSYVADFDATNLTSGTYFYTIRTNEFTQTKKMVVIK